MHSHQGKYILYYINHQSINPLTSINHLTSINQTIGINDNMIQHKFELWVANYGFPKFFGRSLVEGHVDPSHSYHPQDPTSTMEFHPPSNPTMRFDLHWTHKLQGSSAFSTLALNAPFSFLCKNPQKSRNPELSMCFHVAPAFGPFGSIRSNIPAIEEFDTLALQCFDTSVLNAYFSSLRALPPKSPKSWSPKILPCGSGLRAFHLAHNVVSQIPKFPKSQNPEGVHSRGVMY
jgi:hypothetical protein